MSIVTPVPARPRSRCSLAARPVVAIFIAVVLAAAFTGVSSAAQAPVNLGTADSFAVLAGAGITNTNATTIVGDVGTFPTPAETGFGTVTQTGTNHDADAVTQQAKNDLVTAFNQAIGAGPPTAVAVELGGTTVTPGVYNGPTLGITGTLTLDTQGDPNAVFIFQSGSTLITAANSAVTVLNGGTACNVFWAVPSSATLGVNSHLIGSVLASTAITATSGATIEGRLLAQTAAVTLDHNTITALPCAPVITTTTSAAGGVTTTTAVGVTTTTAAAATTTTAPAGPTSTTVAPTTSTPGATVPTTPATAVPSPPGESTAPPANETPGASTTTATTGTTGTTGAPTTPGGPTPPTTVRPPLPRTGFDNRLPLVGSATLAFGLLMTGLAKARRQH